jgi:nitrate/nitrite transporter NarK
LPKNVAGGAIGLINSLGALGSFAGSYLVGYLNTQTGNFNASYTLMAVALMSCYHHHDHRYSCSRSALPNPRKSATLIIDAHHILCF